jgi:hypothetical protein
VVFNLIIVSLFLKFNISTMGHYKIMKENVSERPRFRVYISIFIYIAVMLKFIYIFNVENDIRGCKWNEAVSNRKCNNLSRSNRNCNNL